MPLQLSGYCISSAKALKCQFSKGEIIQTNTTFAYRLLRIALLLIVSAIGLASRKVIGICISALALAWTGIEYLFWYAWSSRILQEAGLSSFPVGTTHMFGLEGARWWNIVVLIGTLALLLWEIIAISNIVRSRTSRRKSRTG